jgi:hypothetical protein
MGHVAFFFATEVLLQKYFCNRHLGAYFFCNKGVVAEFFFSSSLFLQHRCCCRKFTMEIMIQNATVAVVLRCYLQLHRCNYNKGRSVMVGDDWRRSAAAVPSQRQWWRQPTTSICSWKHNFPRDKPGSALAAAASPPDLR